MKEGSNIGFKMLGLLLGAGMIGSNFALRYLGGSLPENVVYPLATALVVEGALLDQLLFKEKKYDKLFRLCGLENKDKKLPIVIKKQKNKKAGTITLIIHMPEGISQHHFEAKREELEQNLNAKIDFGFNKNLVMKLINMNLKTHYDFTYEDREDPTEFLMGHTHEGKFYFSLDEAVQTLIAGEPKSGKSSFLRTMVLSLILNKHPLIINLIDFQDAELGIFSDCKKVKSYGTKPEDFDRLLDEMDKEMERRSKLFASVRNKHYIQNLSVWNKFFPERAEPFIINVIDEFSRISDYETIMQKFRNAVALQRKFGILWAAAMQRPDVSVIKGSVKGSMPTRLAYKVVSDTDSEVILDVKGAEKIKHKGRCLMKYLGELKEVQTIYIEPDDVRGILKQHKAFKTHEEIQFEKRQQAQREEERNQQLKEEFEAAKKWAEEEERISRQQTKDRFHQTYNNPYGIKGVKK